MLPYSVTLDGSACAAGAMPAPAATSRALAIMLLFIGRLLVAFVGLGGGWKGNGRAARRERAGGGDSEESADQRRALVVETPAGDQVLHRDRVVALAQAVAQVQLVRGLDRGHVQRDA